MDYQRDSDSLALANISGGYLSNYDFVHTPAKANGSYDARIEQDKEQRSVRRCEVAGNKHGE
jgi:hypothetical protein